MYPFFRSLLFRLDPEAAHQLTLQLIRLGGYQPCKAILLAMFAAPQKPVEAFGLRFRNPVGLAAGYDKDGIAFRGLSTLGFGHIEIGTVTPRPQPGNPKPRIFRLVEDRAVINRMGFPGKGAEYVAVSLRDALKGRRHSPAPPGTCAGAQRRGKCASGAGVHLHEQPVQVQVSNPRPSEEIASPAAQARNGTIIGVNLGKNKDTPLEEAAGDYLSLLRTFTPLADYLAVNVSSPNTVGLRRLQGRAMLEGLLDQIAKERASLAPNPSPAGRGRIPILVKLAPDLSDGELDDALEAVLRTGMDGVIATNTTLERPGLRSRNRTETGGLSGEPLGERSAAVLKRVVKSLAGRLPVVSVGGIMGPEDAKSRLEAGAALVQVYTGLVYAGPGLVKQILLQL